MLTPSKVNEITSSVPDNNCHAGSFFFPKRAAERLKLRDSSASTYNHRFANPQTFRHSLKIPGQSASKGVSPTAVQSHQAAANESKKWLLGGWRGQTQSPTEARRARRYRMTGAKNT
jgi:hypothetical protein